VVVLAGCAHERLPIAAEAMGCTIEQTERMAEGESFPLPKPYRMSAGQAATAAGGAALGALAAAIGATSAGAAANAFYLPANGVLVTAPGGGSTKAAGTCSSVSMAASAREAMTPRWRHSCSGCRA